MNNNFNSKKLITSVFITVLLLYFMFKTTGLNSKIIFVPFWMIGIYIVKRSLLNNQTNRNGKMPIHIGIVISVISVLVLLIAGIMLLIQGVMKSDMKLFFAGGFFTFGAFTFVLAALTVKGYFECCKVDVLGLYIGILFVAIGVGIIAMIYRQKFGLWIIIPVLMIGAGMIQIIKCIRNEKDNK